MRKTILISFFLSSLVLSFSVFAQHEVEEFKPLPKGIEKIKAIQHSINEGDTTSENLAEYNFDKKGNLINYVFFLFDTTSPFYTEKQFDYDSLNRIEQINMYQERFGDVTIKYYYPSKNENITVSDYDRTGFYTYIKSEFTFDSTDRISEEILYDSTFNRIDSSLSITKKYITYSYDTQGNKIEELHSNYFTKESIYEMHQVYDKEKLIKSTRVFSKTNPNPNYDYYADEIKVFFYIKEGDFEDRISKETHLNIIKNDTLKSEIIYVYQKLDAETIIKEKKDLNRGQVMQSHKYFYKNNHLIKLEQYTIQKGFDKPKLSSWTEYSYFFYPKTKE